MTLSFASLADHFLCLLNSALQLPTASTSRDSIVSWIAPFTRSPTKTLEGCDGGSESLFQKLGQAEFGCLLRFLDITDLARFGMALPQRLQRQLHKSATELHFRPFESRWSASLCLRPTFTPAFLSHFPALRTFKLHHIWFLSTETFEESPFKSLPPTLTHFEVSLTRQADDLLRGFSFGDAFPQLEVCKVVADILHPEWVITLPSSLLALLVRNTAETDFIYSFVCGTIQEPYVDENNDDKILLLPQSSPPFPSLLVLEIAFDDDDPEIELELLPSTVTWFSWMSPSDDELYLTLLESEKSKLAPKLGKPKDRAILRSLRMHSSDEDNSPLEASSFPLDALGFISDPQYDLLPSSLTSIRFPTYFAKTLQDDLFKSIHSKGIKLRTLELFTIGASVGSADDRSMIASVLSSVKSLRLKDWIESTSGLFPLLPSTLESLILQDASWGHWGEKEIRSLPPSLTELCSGPTSIELGFVPLLPRSLVKLNIRLTNFHLLGTTFVTPEMRLDGLPYDTIGLETRLLFGLPPNLRYLTLCFFSDFESAFGLFLPRTLLKVTGSTYNNSRIDTYVGSESDILATGIHHLADRIGVRLAATEKEALLQRSISFFPPGCVCSLPFVGYTQDEVEPFVSGTIKETL